MKKLMGIAILSLALMFSSALASAQETKKDDSKNKGISNNDKGSNSGKSGSFGKGKRWIIYW